MSVDIWWLGLPDSPNTEAKICVRADATGTVGVTCNGTRFTASADTAVDDGNVAVTVTGLSAGTSYPAVIDFDSTPAVTTTVSTFSLTGSYKVGYGSCMSYTEIMAYGYHAGDNCDVFVFMGDAPYLDTVANTLWGETTVDISDNQTVSNMYAYHRRVRRTPGVEYLMHRVPVLFMWDDHELPGDNWDHTIAQTNTGGGAPNPNVTLQSEVDALFVTSQSAFEAYAKGNPSNSDSPAVEAPFMADAAAANYHVKYFRITLGNTEYFVTDCITHRGPVGAATRTAETLADADATMLGTTQAAWLKTRLNASTATNKVWMTGKKTYVNTTDNSDTWDEIGDGSTWPGFITERDSILDYIHANVIGVSVVAGDRHAFSVVAQYNGVDSATRDHVCVIGCPLGSGQINSQGAGFNDFVRIISEESNYGICDGRSDRMKLSVVQAVRGFNPVWRGEVLATGNALSYPSVRATI